MAGITVLENQRALATNDMASLKTEVVEAVRAAATERSGLHGDEGRHQRWHGMRRPCPGQTHHEGK
jgi:hypothetical protein